MHKNSLEVYSNLVLPSIKAKHEAVINALKVLGKATVYELSDYLNKPVHALSGRLTELSGTKEYQKPIIEGVGDKKNKYGNACTLWQIKKTPEKLEQSNLFE